MGPFQDEMDERTPLLQFQTGEESFQNPTGTYLPASSSPQQDNAEVKKAYHQFCHLVGNRPVELEAGKHWTPPPDTLYSRVSQHRKWQGWIYVFTASLTNTLLLSQVVLGAALTGLGASDSSRVLITVFGALNTIIAGLVAFLKSRGQPMRARMFRDDLDRVVDEIDNSATMWLGISRGLHGYNAYDTDEVTVRSEVARLTRLYDRAVKTNTMNDPDFYSAAGLPADPHSAALRNRPQTAGQPAPGPVSPSGAGAVTDSAPAGPAAANTTDPDESPATKVSSSPKDAGKDPKKDSDKSSNKSGDSKPAGDKMKQGQEPATSKPGGSKTPTTGTDGTADDVPDGASPTAGIEQSSST